VFDVGANVGEWSRYCLSLMPSFNIHLFEPSQVTFKTLQDNLWPGHIRLNNFGLGEHQEQLDLNIVDDGSGMNSIYMRHGVEGIVMGAVERISISTIDDYCKDNFIPKIDLLKIDVEGHELAVLKGAKNMLKERRIKRIQFEYGGCYLDARVYLRDIWDYLTDFRFNLYKLHPEGPRKIDQYDQQIETFKYSNWIAIIRSI
jgi:FkbM family methyltransferase